MVAAAGACLGWGAEASADAGAKVYAAKCASCHAKDGTGNPTMAKVFKVEPEKVSVVSDAALAKSDADLAKTTSEGAGKMPAYKGKLTDAQIADVVAYIRTLAPAKK
jgi:mono/diheme cytochrome c family protein